MVHTTQTDCEEQRFALIITWTPPKWHCRNFWLTWSHELNDFWGFTSVHEDHVSVLHNRNIQHSYPVRDHKGDSWIVFFCIWCDNIIAEKDCHAGGLIFILVHSSAWGQLGIIELSEISSTISPALFTFSGVWDNVTGNLLMQPQLCESSAHWGRVGGETNGEKSWVTAISTAVSEICMVEGLLGHPELLGNTLVGNDGLCHSTCKRIHGRLSY